MTITHNNVAGPSRLSTSPKKTVYPVWPDTHDEAEYFEVPPDHFLAQQRGPNKARGQPGSSSSDHVLARRTSTSSAISTLSQASMPASDASILLPSLSPSLQPLSELATAVRAGIPALPSSLGHITQPLDRLADAVPRPAGFSTVSEQIPDTSTLAAADFDVDVRSGFLPPEAPVRRLGGLHAEHWEQALDQAKCIPLMQSGGGATITQHQRLLARRWRRSLRQMPVLPLSDELANDIRFARRGHVVLSFLAHFYIHSQPRRAADDALSVAPQRTWLNMFSRKTAEELEDEQDLADELAGKYLRRVPAAIAVPWVQLSQKLDLPPVLTYATTVLWNWDYNDPTRGLEPDNLRIVQTFTATPSEHHFFFTSLLIEARGVEALELMRVSLDEAFVADRVARRRIAGYLNRLAVVIKDLTKLLHDVRNGCDPKVFYWGIRPWFVGSDTVDKGEQPGWHFEGVDPEGVMRVFSGPSAGQSSMIHAIDVFLDVDHTRRKERLNRPAATATGDARGADATFMERMSLYMPGHHRAFLSHLRNISFDDADADEQDDDIELHAGAIATDDDAGSDVEQDVLPRELPHPIRSLALKAKTEDDDEGLPAAYDNALKELKGLRDEHMKVAYLYIVAQARGSPPDAYAPLPKGFTGEPDVDRRLAARAAKMHADVEAEAAAMLDTNSKDNGGGAKGTGGTDLVSFLRDCRVNTIDAFILAKDAVVATAATVAAAADSTAAGTSSGQSTSASPASHNQGDFTTTATPQSKLTDHSVASASSLDVDSDLQIWAVDVSAHSEAMTEQQLREHVAALLPGDANAADREKVLRYYRQVDRVRSLVARLLPRFLLATRFDVPWHSMRFSTTREGRPFVSAPQLPVHVDFNISHDSDWVVMAFSISPRNDGAIRVGADVMALELPRYEPDIRTFVETMDMALTASETRWVLEPVGAGAEGDRTALARLFALWTHKEAYTKNVGVGLGFDFSRIQFDFPPHAQARLSIDGAVQAGYVFTDVLLAAAGSEGVAAQLVVCHGPQAGAGGFGAQIPAAQAEQQGLLRVFTLPQLVACVQAVL
ncbi:related to BNA2-tryptophan 2,3-dioxygenase [Sporisorium reilianum f. sp. reilianum]|uniref:Related to BNA2-tryptophan 2,3-dioxygenase n=1 Tax=Sporisorium reilianum f. sp. reilianum TaxID=72559 RepID=A0A2N8UH33_9BASI|nr:related to BNA2-tryptophan 2,3-dioxygenase [Sporisorium reilianum f. sp. reilianum]